MLPSELIAWQYKLKHPTRATVGIDDTMLAKEAKGERRLFTMTFTIPFGMRLQFSSACPMFLLGLATCPFPNMQRTRAAWRFLTDMEESTTGRFVRLPIVALDGDVSLQEGMSWALNGCSAIESFRRIEASIANKDEPTRSTTLLAREKWHLYKMTERWSKSSMKCSPSQRLFLSRFLFLCCLRVMNTGVPSKRRDAMKGVLMTADEAAEALLQVKSFQRFCQHIMQAPSFKLQSRSSPLPPLLAAEETETELDADGLPPADTSAAATPPRAADLESAKALPSVVVVGDTLERLFYVDFEDLWQVRMYLLSERGAEGNLRWLIKVDGIKGITNVHTQPINLSRIIETEDSLLARLDAGEEVSLPNPFANPSLCAYYRRYRIHNECAALWLFQRPSIDSFCVQGVCQRHRARSDGAVQLRAHDGGHQLHPAEAGGSEGEAAAGGGAEALRQPLNNDVDRCGGARHHGAAAQGASAAPYIASYSSHFTVQMFLSTSLQTVPEALAAAASAASHEGTHERKG